MPKHSFALAYDAFSFSYKRLPKDYDAFQARGELTGCTELRRDALILIELSCSQSDLPKRSEFIRRRMGVLALTGPLTSSEMSKAIANGDIPNTIPWMQKLFAIPEPGYQVFEFRGGKIARLLQGLVGWHSVNPWAVGDAGCCVTTSYGAEWIPHHQIQAVDPEQKLLRYDSAL